LGEIKKANLFTAGQSSHKVVKDVHGDSGEDNEGDNRQYCQSCLQYGIRSKLKRRMYKVQANDGKPKLVPAVVPDAEKFRQCYHCGDIVPLYNVKYESKIEDFVDTIDNPFDANPGNMQGFTPCRKLKKSKSIYERKKEQIASIKDDDIRRELADGANQLGNYTES
jgi:hypothetical protein